MTFFSISTPDSGDKTLTLLYGDGKSTSLNETHPNFNRIVDSLVSGEATDDSVRDLVDSSYAVGVKLAKVSERVSVTPYGVFFDGDPLRGELAETILSLWEEDDTEKLKPIINFLEKVKTNPSVRSVDDLYRWITNGGFVLAPNGDFIGYKGVQLGKDGIPQSIHTGTATVDGVQHRGHIPYPEGAVVEMPRSEVDPNSSSYCSTGLHVGTHHYASWFSNHKVMLVQVNPRDVVSVPEDHNNEKLRVCRYVILSFSERLESALYEGDDYSRDEYDEEGSDEYDEEYYDDNDIDPEDYVDYDESEDDESSEEDDSDSQQITITLNLVRDSNGRFTKGVKVDGLPRDENGRWVKTK